MLWPLARYRPTLVVTGRYHAATVPRWLPRGGREIIPYGVLDRFRGAAERASRRRRARSSPRTRCAGSIGCSICGRRGSRRRCPGAELHIYAGPAVYGGAAARRRGAWKRCSRAPTRCTLGRAPPSPRSAATRLAEVLAEARVMLYRGDPGETFCLALAEAQAMGVPAVVQPLGSVAERVVDGRHRPGRGQTTASSSTAAIARAARRRAVAALAPGCAGDAARPVLGRGRRPLRALLG